VKWSPRKPNKKHKPCTSTKAKKYNQLTHNQLCSTKYFEAIQSGISDHDDALATAIANLQAELASNEDTKRARREKRAKARHEDSDGDETSVAGSNVTGPSDYSSKGSGSAASSTRDAAESGDDRYRSNSRGGCTISLVPLKRDSPDEELEEGEVEEDMMPLDSEVIELSSDEGETSSASDSE
jgi:hypothetical protein